MARILAHVEGQTEEEFVNQLLSPHLFKFGHTIFARLLGNSRQRSRRGGIRFWHAVRKETINNFGADPVVYLTTIVDFYALPATGEGKWPGRDAPANLTVKQKANRVNEALTEDISNALGDNFNLAHFVPNVIMHEFEGLLFSACESFTIAIGRVDMQQEFQSIRDKFETPEDINDSYETAPSKRIKKLVSGYQKPLYGNLAALEVGLETIRLRCPIFNE